MADFILGVAVITFIVTPITMIFITFFTKSKKRNNMKEFKTENYKNVGITYYISDDGKFWAKSIAGSTCNNSSDGGINKNYPTFDRCEVDIKGKIDLFLEETPKTYEELADALTGGLTWTGYEDCYLDTQVVEILVGNFINYTTNKK